MLRALFKYKKEEMTGGWRKLHNGVVNVSWLSKIVKTEEGAILG